MQSYAKRILQKHFPVFLSFLDYAKLAPLDYTFSEDSACACYSSLGKPCNHKSGEQTPGCPNVLFWALLLLLLWLLYCAQPRTIFWKVTLIQLTTKTIFYISFHVSAISQYKNKQINEMTLNGLSRRKVTNKFPQDFIKVPQYRFQYYFFSPNCSLLATLPYGLPFNIHNTLSALLTLQMKTLRHMLRYPDRQPVHSSRDRNQFFQFKSFALPPSLNAFLHPVINSNLQPFLISIATLLYFKHLFYLQIKCVDCMIETLPDLLKANFNRMRPSLSPKHSLGRLKISKQTDMVSIKVINVSQLYMETGANDSLFSFKSPKK